jgi:hypothetical protein
LFGECGLKILDTFRLTAQEDGYQTADDATVLDRATGLQRVLFTQNEDLLAEAKYRQSEGIPFPGVIYGHQLRLTVGRCVQDLELIAQVREPEEMINRVEYLPL